MLSRKLAFGPNLGAIAEIHFETPDVGHVLDDLLLVLKRGERSTRCVVSVKSNRRLTKAGFNTESVHDA